MSTWGFCDGTEGLKATDSMGPVMEQKGYPVIEQKDSIVTKRSCDRTKGLNDNISVLLWKRRVKGQHKGPRVPSKSFCIIFSLFTLILAEEQVYEKNPQRCRGIKCSGGRSGLLRKTLCCLRSAVSGHHSWRSDGSPSAHQVTVLHIKNNMSAER